MRRSLGDSARRSTPIRGSSSPGSPSNRRRPCFVDRFIHRAFGPLRIGVDSGRLLRARRFFSAFRILAFMCAFLGSDLNSYFFLAESDEEYLICALIKSATLIPNRSNFLSKSSCLKPCLSPRCLRMEEEMHSMWPWSSLDVSVWQRGSWCSFGVTMSVATSWFVFSTVLEVGFSCSLRSTCAILCSAFFLMAFWQNSLPHFFSPVLLLMRQHPLPMLSRMDSLRGVSSLSSFSCILRRSFFNSLL